MTRTALRQWLGGLLVAFLALSAAYSEDVLGLRERFPPPAQVVARPPAAPVVGEDAAGDAVSQPVLRSQPWWQPVASFDGNGAATTRAFIIDPGALQWRVSWRCEQGGLSLQPQDPAGEAVGHRLAEAAACPGEGEGFWVQPGTYQLDVRTGGPWKITVEQQVDVPLVEPPHPAMAKAEVLARGRFHDIDETGEGTVTIYRLAGGQLMARLQDFYVTPNVDLELRFSTLPAPRTTRDVAAAPFADTVFLSATTGSMNVTLPRDLELTRFRSVVIWCELTANAYAAAPLRR